MEKSLNPSDPCQGFLLCHKLEVRSVTIIRVAIKVTIRVPKPGYEKDYIIYQKVHCKAYLKGFFMEEDSKAIQPFCFCCT